MKYVPGTDNFYLDETQDPPVGYVLVDNEYIEVIPTTESEYPYWTVWCYGTPVRYPCHITIASLLIPNETNAPVVNRKNGDKQDYSVNNLEWVTQRENVLHAQRNDLIPKTTNSVKVRKICEMIRDGYSNQEISKELGVSGAVVCNIRHGRRHRQILEEVLEAQDSLKYILSK